MMADVTLQGCSCIPLGALQLQLLRLTEVDVRAQYPGVWFAFQPQTQ